MPQEQRRPGVALRWLRRAALLPLAAVTLSCAAPGRERDRPRVLLIDDGERVAHDDRALELPRGPDDPVWGVGQTARLFGLPGEVLALQVVVSAPDREPLTQVQVELPSLQRDPGGADSALQPDPSPLLASDSAPERPAAIERFVVHDLSLSRRSGGRVPGESLGWAASAMPPLARADATVTSVPDVLIPLALAPPWADYPMSVAPGEHRVVWIDITLPDALPAGRYRGALTATAGAAVLALIPIELQVGPTPLPYAAAPTLVYYDPAAILQRTGSPVAVQHYLQLMHRHHLTTVHRVNDAADVARQRGELSGALFTAAAGYQGPGAGRPLDVVSLGTYGTLGDPSPAALARVRGALDALDSLDAALLRPPRRQVFLYAIDEQCQSPRAARWRQLLRAAGVDPRLLRLQVAQTCSRPPAEQPVDLALLEASALPLVSAAQAAAGPQQVWIYNGALPRTGSFLLDGGTLSLRGNAWLQARHRIPRWFYWESTFWNDDNRGGRGPVDPLVQAETFHNQHGDHANGDGVLVYPGQQRGPEAAAGRWRSLGFPGVLPSLRLKQWRRGVQDVGYLQLARQRGVAAPAVNAQRTPTEVQAAVEEVLRQIIPADGASQPFPRDGATFYRARRRLFDLIVSGAP